MRENLIVANWKLNGDWSLCKKFASYEWVIPNNTSVIVCPPNIYLKSFCEALTKNESPLKSGAQDVSEWSGGAYTGHISATMLKEASLEYVIIGHSERRQWCMETDEQVALKVRQALMVGLHPIVCVGESLEQREADQTLKVIESQLSPVLRVLEELGTSLKDVSFAYEPRWAIGTGKSATPEQAQLVHKSIREFSSTLDSSKNLRILYGGSVTDANINSLLAMSDINGALVGGASLKAETFDALIKQTN